MQEGIGEALHVTYHPTLVTVSYPSAQRHAAAGTIKQHPFTLHEPPIERARHLVFAVVVAPGIVVLQLLGWTVHDRAARVWYLVNR
jgi:hypothetical protein